MKNELTPLVIFKFSKLKILRQFKSVPVSTAQRGFCERLGACSVPSPPVCPGNWDAYSDSVYGVFPLCRVGSGLVEMVVGTTRKPSSLEVNVVTLFSSWQTAGPTPRISISHCQQFVSKETSNGTDKVQNDPPPPTGKKTSQCVSLPVFGCLVIPPRPRPSPVSVCLLCSGPVPVHSALFEKREESLVPVGDAVGSSGRLAA